MDMDVTFLVGCRNDFLSCTDASVFETDTREGIQGVVTRRKKTWLRNIHRAGPAAGPAAAIRQSAALSDELGQGGLDVRQHAVPVARLRLPKKPRGRIPG